MTGRRLVLTVFGWILLGGCASGPPRPAPAGPSCILLVSGEPGPGVILTADVPDLRLPNARNISERAYQILLGLQARKRWRLRGMSASDATVLDLAAWEEGRRALLDAGIPISYPRNDVQRRRFSDVLSRIRDIDADLVCQASMTVDERVEDSTRFRIGSKNLRRERGFEYTVAVTCQYRLVSSMGAALAYSPGATRTWSDWRSAAERLAHFPGDYWEEVDELIVEEAEEFLEYSATATNPNEPPIEPAVAYAVDEFEVSGPMAAQTQIAEPTEPHVGKGDTKEAAVRDAQRETLNRFFLTKTPRLFPWASPDRHARLIHRVLLERAPQISVISGEPIYSQDPQGWAATVQASVDVKYANAIGIAVRDYLEKNGNPPVLVAFAASTDIAAERRTVASEVENAIREAGFSHIVDQEQFDKNLDREAQRLLRTENDDREGTRELLARNRTPLLIRGEVRTSVVEQSAGARVQQFAQFVVHFEIVSTNAAVRTYSDHASYLLNAHENSQDASEVLGEEVGARCASALLGGLAEMALSGDDVLVRFIGVELDAGQDEELVNLVGGMSGVTNAIRWDVNPSLKRPEIVVKTRTDVSGLTLGANLSSRTLKSGQKLVRRGTQNEKTATLEIQR